MQLPERRAGYQSLVREFKLENEARLRAPVSHNHHPVSRNGRFFRNRQIRQRIHLQERDARVHWNAVLAENPHALDKLK